MPETDEYITQIDPPDLSNIAEDAAAATQRKLDEIDSWNKMFLLWPDIGKSGKEKD